MSAYPGVDGTQPCVTDPELYFDYDGRNAWKIPHAVALCRRCPFIRSCLGYALTNDVSGIWGATTGAQRRTLRATHGITAEPVTVTDLEQRRRDIAQVDAGHLSAAEVSIRVGIAARTVVRHRSTRRSA